MTVTAVFGLIVNLVAAVMLGLGGHGHNMNTRAALAHVLTDALGSVGAIVAGALVLLFGWNRADPLVSSLIGVLVLWGGWRLVRDTSRVLMEGSPVEIDIADLEGRCAASPAWSTFTISTCGRSPTASTCSPSTSSSPRATTASRSWPR